MSSRPFMVSGTNLNQTLASDQLNTINNLGRRTLWLPLVMTAGLSIIACCQWHSYLLLAVYALIAIFFSFTPHLLHNAKPRLIHNSTLVLLKVSTLFLLSFHQTTSAFTMWPISWLYLTHSGHHYRRWLAADLGTLAITGLLFFFQPHNQTKNMLDTTTFLDSLLLIIILTLLLSLIFTFIAKIEWFKQHLFLYNQGLLSSVIIHQLQQPIQYCHLEIDKITCQYQDNKTHTQQSKQQAQLLEKIKDINQQLNLVTDVIRCYQPLRNSRRQQPATAINDIVTQAADIVSQQAKKKKVKISVQAPKTVMTLDHPCLTCQVLINILINSIQAFPKKKNLLVKNNCHQRMVKVCLKKKKQLTIITITDNGPGFQHQDAAGSSPMLTANNHYSLGLYLVKMIVETELRGEVEISAQAKQGTQIKLILPAVNNYL